MAKAKTISAVLSVELSLTTTTFFGKTVLVAYLLQSFIAVLLLEYVNYIEHYGLVRSENETAGRFYERLGYEINPVTSFGKRLDRP